MINRYIAMNLHINDCRIDMLFLRRAWCIIKPYWARKANWLSWLGLFAYVGYSVFEVGLGAQLSILTKHLTDDLVAKNQTSYWHWFALVALIWAVIGDGGENFGVVSQLSSTVWTSISIHWRQWITRDLTRRYLAHQVYFRIEQDNDVDNVDQRIQQEVEPVCLIALFLPSTLIHSVTSFSVQGWILRSISPTLFYATLAYAALFMLITWWLYAKLIHYEYQTTVAEADLRFGFLHIRTNAETIALYKGEKAEDCSVTRRLGTLTLILYAKLRYSTLMGLVKSALNLAWALVPILILVPSYFRDEISFGTITQGAASAAILLGTTRRFSNLISASASAAPHIVRLAQFEEKFNSVADEEAECDKTIRLDRGAAVVLDSVTLQTPGFERTLTKNLSITVSPGDSLLITGRTGVGKSALLRGMAGLWRNGSGRIVMPPSESVLFLPQRPYMLLGTLREQLLYPFIDRHVSDTELQRRLDRVNLPELAARHGGFDATIDWSRVLSLGEQQRIGFARALASNAKFIFLDEATSAVDLATEALLYRALIDAGIALVSVGHRSSLFDYHHKVLDLLPNGGWTLNRTGFPVDTNSWENGVHGNKQNRKPKQA